MRHYDVVIMGGGPAGSTVGALLGKRTDLRVALYEQFNFPREHIGESFAHRVIPILAQSGALEKVIASDCWIKKYGGYYVWDKDAPSVSLFETSAYAKDGVYRWAIHVNRPQFDKILLDHAASTGIDVHEGCPITGVRKVDGRWEVSLRDEQRVSCDYFIEASGRRTGLVGDGSREYLSEYKNIAIWTHVLGGRPAQSVDADWNVFRTEDLSAIGSFAFEDGWLWYIPVPKIVDGRRRITHSLGMVTSPEVLKQRRDAYLEYDAFLAAAKQVPILGDLISDATPVESTLKTATNYSMIRRKFCDFDEKWIVIGDSAYFVDPLFSSGVAFATNQAATASLLVACATAGVHERAKVRDLWLDHDLSWHRVARGFALMIDQWYHGIAVNNPRSLHWKTRANVADSAVRASTLHALVDADVSPDLIEVITGGTGVAADGPLKQFSDRQASLPSPDAMLELHPDARWRESLSLGLDLLRRPVPADRLAALGAWWSDPIANHQVLPQLFAEPVPCRRVSLPDQSMQSEVSLYSADFAAVERLGTRASQAEWARALPVDSLRRLLEAGLLRSVE